MKTFVMDLWYDLRQKRLWPVAAVLLLALVAVPVVLSKPAKETPPPAVPQADRQASDQQDLKALAAVQLDDSAPADASDLDTFDPSNPFRPPASARPHPAKEEQVKVTETESVQETVDEGSGSTGGGGTTTTPATPPSGKTKTETTEYQYVIDVTFTANGRTRHLKGMQRLDMLPNQSSPLLLFLGVSDSGGNGVFLVDSTLTAAGEGHCKPSGDKCSMLYLGPGSRHQFTNADGDSYELRIDEIRKVKVEKTSSAAKHKASASVGAKRRFVPALISDLVSVSTSGDETSTPDSDGR